MDELRATQVDLRGILAVLGANLYSTPLVAVRELVQNAHDSITRRHLEDEEFSGGSIRIHSDLAAGVLCIEDDGAGLTEDEIHTYLATVGRGYTGQLRKELGDEERSLLGMFGLGFLSAFTLADEVLLTTTSYRDPGATWRYRSTNAERYTVSAAEPARVGTTVELRLRTEHQNVAGNRYLEDVLRHYCALLTVPVRIGDPDTEPINGVPPPWRDEESLDHPIVKRRRRLEFASRMDSRFQPVCTIDVSPGDGSDAVGLLWIHDALTYGTSDNRNLAVYLRGMLLDDDARDLLPAWAGFVSGVIETTDLTPTASREDLKRDHLYAIMQTSLETQLIHGLQLAAREQPEAWQRVLLRHNEALRGAALCNDQLFNLLVDDILVPTSAGELSAPVIRRLGGGKVHVALGTSGGFEEMLFRSLNVPVARGDRYAVLAFLRRFAAQRNAPIIEIGSARGDAGLFRSAILEGDVCDWLQERLCGDGEEIVPARFEPGDLPFVLVPDREADIKRRLEADETNERIANAALHLARLHTATLDGSVRARLYVNLDSEAITALVECWRDDPGRAEPGARMLRAVKDLLSAGGADNPSTDLGAALRDLLPALRALLA